MSTILSDHATVGKKQRMKAEPPLDACTLFWSFLLDDYSDSEAKEKEAAKKRKSKVKDKTKRRFEPLVISDEHGRFEPSLAGDENNDGRSQSWEFLEGTASTDGEPIVFMSEKQRQEYKEFREWRKSRSEIPNQGKASRSEFDDESSYSDEDSATLDTRESVTIDTRGRDYEDGSNRSFDSEERFVTRKLDKKSSLKKRSKSKSTELARGHQVERRRSDDGKRSKHERNPSPDRPRLEERVAKSKVKEESRVDNRRRIRGKALQEKRKTKSPEKLRPKDKESKSSRWKPSIWRKDNSEKPIQSESRPPLPSKSALRRAKTSKKDVQRGTDTTNGKKSELTPESPRLSTKSNQKPSTNGSKQESQNQTIGAINRPIATRRLSPPIAVRKIHSFDGVVQSPAEEVTFTSTKQPKRVSSPSNKNAMDQMEAEQQNYPNYTHHHQLLDQTDDSREYGSYDETPEVDDETPAVDEENSPPFTPTNAFVLVGGENSAFTPTRVSPEVLAFKPITHPNESRQDRVFRTDSEITRETQPEEHASPAEVSAVDVEEAESTATSVENPYERETINGPRWRSKGYSETESVPKQATKGKQSRGFGQGFMFINRVRSGDSSVKSVDRGTLGALRKKKQLFRPTEPFSVS